VDPDLPFPFTGEFLRGRNSYIPFCCGYFICGDLYIGTFPFQIPLRAFCRGENIKDIPFSWQGEMGRGAEDRPLIISLLQLLASL
jgi:hypothetical protein